MGPDLYHSGGWEQQIRELNWEASHLSTHLLDTRDNSSLCRLKMRLAFIWESGVMHGEESEVLFGAFIPSSIGFFHTSSFDYFITSRVQAAKQYQRIRYIDLSK